MTADADGTSWGLAGSRGRMEEAELFGFSLPFGELTSSPS